MGTLKTLLAASACALALTAHAGGGVSEPASAASGARTGQQNKMVECNHQASDMKGDERQAFMKACLSAKPTQQERMTLCNARAKGQTGDARRAFMKECLSGGS